MRYSVLFLSFLMFLTPSIDKSSFIKFEYIGPTDRYKAPIVFYVNKIDKRVVKTIDGKIKGYWPLHCYKVTENQFQTLFKDINRQKKILPNPDCNFQITYSIEGNKVDSVGILHRKEFQTMVDNIIKDLNAYKYKKSVIAAFNKL